MRKIVAAIARRENLTPYFARKRAVRRGLISANRGRPQIKIAGSRRGYKPSATR